jgi:hypothetical protein
VCVGNVRVRNATAIVWRAAEDQEMHGPVGLVGQVGQVGLVGLPYPPDLPVCLYCGADVFAWFARKPWICFTA